MAVLVLAALSGLSQTITVGTNSLELVFEDPTLPQTNRVRIAADLMEALDWASNLNDAFAVGGNAPLGFGHIREPFDMAMSSDLWNGVCLTNTADGLRCRVTRELSDGHARRLASYSGREAQIAALRTRISAVNTNSFDSLSIQEKADFFWRGGTVPANLQPEQAAAFENEIVPMIRGYVIHPPSIFRLEGQKTIDGDTAVLCGWCVFVPRPGSGNTICAVPVGLVNGEWKFYFGM